MLKRLICILISMFMLSSCIAFAGGAPSVSVPREFYENTSREGSEKVSSLLGMKDDELNRYCKDNNILYIAVNKDNTKQIRITRYQNEFSKKIDNLSNLDKTEITSLISEISGTSNATGEVVEKDLQNFILTSQSSTDSGGEYVLTRYITIAGGLTYVLSFYTSSGIDLDYTNEVFDSFTAEDFYTAKTGSGNILINAILVCIIILVVISLAIIVSIFLDCKHEHDNDKILIGEDLMEQKDTQEDNLDQADGDDSGTSDADTIEEATKEPVLSENQDEQ